jgi:hypothetical protein
MMQEAARQLVPPLVATALVGLLVSPPPRVENTKMALRVLHLSQPDVQWHEPPVRADFTDDQISDLAIAGASPERVVVVLIVGPVDSGSRMLWQSWNVGGEGLDAECARNAQLLLEELELPLEMDAKRSLEAKTARSRGVKGLKLVAPPCDVFHLYWDPDAGGISWWR